MKGKHHVGILQAAAELAQLWQSERREGRELAPPGFEVDRIVEIFGSPEQVEQMAEWSSEADDVKDLVVAKGLASFIMRRLSGTTSFQHFAYSGAFGDLEDGPTTVHTYEGYCWDCDPHLKWYEELANLSVANVSFTPDCGVFDEAFFAGCPAAQRVSGKADWDDQVYPSALELAQFYGMRAAQLKVERPDWARQSLCFALHMLHDMAVPHHVLGTIEFEHAEYELDMLDFWKIIHAGRSARGKRAALLHQIGPRVHALLAGPLAGAGTWYELGTAAVDLTRARLPSDPHQAPARTKLEAREMSAQAIACTLAGLAMW